MAEGDIFDFLDQYTERYSDYATLIPLNDEYVDICFGTAECLFEILTKCQERTFEMTLDTLIKEKYLMNDDVLIEGSMDTNSQNHAWIMLPSKVLGRVILIQSLGAIYGAFYTLWNPDELATELKKLERADGQRLFCFVDDKIRKDKIKLRYQVCPRERIRPSLLPDLSSKRDYLNGLRDQYLKDREVTSSNKDSLGLYNAYINKKSQLYINKVGTLYRMPDSLGRIWRLHQKEILL